MARDPVCGMMVDEASGLRAERAGQTYYFCCEHCRQKFLETPNSEHCCPMLTAGWRQNRRQPRSIFVPCVPAPDRTGRAIVQSAVWRWSGILHGRARQNHLHLSDAPGYRARPSRRLPQVAGMALEPKMVSAEPEDDAGTRALARKFWIGLVLTIPVLFLAMGQWIPGALQWNTGFPNRFPDGWNFC